MSEGTKDVIVMSRRKFMMFFGGTIFGTIVFYGVISQMLDRLF